MKAEYNPCNIHAIFMQNPCKILLNCHTTHKPLLAIFMNLAPQVQVFGSKMADQKRPKILDILFIKNPYNFATEVI